MVNQHSLQDSNGTDYFKKINGSDFSKVALLQKPGDINCLKETDNTDKSCSFPYQCKGTDLYACTQCGQEGRVSYSYRYIILNIIHLTSVLRAPPPSCPTSGAGPT